jgi:hypothetical protein
VKKVLTKSKKILKTFPVVFLGGTLGFLLLAFLALFIRKKDKKSLDKKSQRDRLK